MKSNITTNDCKKEKQFPKLMIHSGGTVVLFDSPTSGVSLFQGDDKNNTKYVGKYRTDWLIKSFKDFHGTVELSND